MNKVVLMGRLTKDPDIRYTQAEEPVCIARYTLAVDRAKKNENGQTADFVSCVIYGKPAEWAEKYLHKGMKIAVSGRIQTGSYINKEGVKVYTTDVVCSEQEFAESKKDTSREAYDDQNAAAAAGSRQQDEFNPFDADEVDEELPFS